MRAREREDNEPSDAALKRFVGKYFPPGTNPYSTDVLEKLNYELQKQLELRGQRVKM